MRTLVIIALAGLITVALDSARTTRAASDGEDEAQQQAVCDAFWQRRSKRLESTHDKEQKDPAWAYSMEQKLSEYTTRQFRAALPTGRSRTMREQEKHAP